MTEDKGKEGSHSDRLEEIKREEKEDASSYYAQGESKDNINEEAELNNLRVFIFQKSVIFSKNI